MSERPHVAADEAETLYDVLGVAADSSEGEIRHAYLAKAKHLHPDRYAGAPQEVVKKVEAATVAVNRAYEVLGDRWRRASYDRELRARQERSRHRQHGGGGLTRESYPSQPGYEPSGVPGLARLEVVLAGLDALVDWLAPSHPRPRTVTVPDFRGLGVHDALYGSVTSDLHPKIVRLTENPAPVEGVVVDQDPPPCTRVRRNSTVTLQVLHPTKATADDWAG